MSPAETKPLTARMRPDGAALEMREYERAGGYQGLRKALAMTPQQVTEEVKNSNLRGRGGAGFPTGMKWSFTPLGPDAPHPKYVVANGDEMEPGTFKDRLLLEQDPHQLVEGMVIAGHATEADIGYIFIRGEYTLGIERTRRAIAEAYAAGYLGRNILGSGFSFELYVHVSAGRYMCGEETGLLNALEGKRANPRAKPPFPPVVGAFGQPTVINNIETLSSVPHIMANGSEWFCGLGKTKDAGTKLYGASGKVKRPGVWELPMGTTIREILFEHAGGMQDGLAFRGLLPGGASTDFLVEEHLDVPMDFTSVQKAGSRMGTGTMIVLDDKTCPVGMVWNLEQFFAQESCGWCTPCWSGLGWAARLLRAMEDGAGVDGDIEKLAGIARFCGPGHTFCALAPGAAEPLQSGIKYFREDFERHIREKRCPWR
ncbi:MAG TPA: NADH-quinone oxidoreductase subunit NuoF [Bryobacteraceae bacterium]|nr:NADH-quinone oxidoreductase subunit NuoF [Bryobacteraceae bacterium]